MSFFHSSTRSNYIRLKVLNVSNHLYWPQLCFVLRICCVCFVFLLVVWNWSTLLKLKVAESDHFNELPVNESEFVFVGNEDIRRPDYRLSHPFENTCHFPTLKTEDPSIDRFVQHSHKVICPKAEFEHLVSQDRDGQFLIGNPFGGVFIRPDIDCFYRELTGALWPNISEYKFANEWSRLPINRPFKMTKDQFAVKCFSKATQNLIYHNAFANIVPRLNSPDVTNRYSIAILQIDSTSRNQFFRHAPKTLRFMHQNGFQILNGYTKVGDNSAINSMALLAGRAFEAKYRALDSMLEASQYLNETQTFDDIFKYVEFLFDKMKKDGCATLFNDDIGKPTAGLFHYQAFNGFRRNPTDHYFRPYYTYIYKNLNAESVCVNGEFLIPKLLNLWERFSTLYKQKCSFSFNHLSFFTHANGNNLELYDEPLFDALERMKNAGVFENTVVLITGDHGQRINKIKHTYYGKIEERMPLAAIHLPDRFRQFHPKLYDRLVQNTNRFTSTFDLHETLKDLTQLRDTNTNQAVSIDNETKRVGRSLFEEIPINRDCKDAKVPENFCVCMQNLDEGIETKVLQLEVLVQIQNYLNDTFSNLTCELKWTMDSKTQPLPTVFAVTPLVRYGPRYIEEWNKRIEADPSKANVFREIVELEQNVSFWIHPSNNLENKTRVEATFRFQHNRIFNDGLAMLSDAWLRKAPCSIYQIPDLCKCSK